MKPVYRLVIVALLAFMFRSPLLRLQQTASHFISTSPAKAVISSTTSVRQTQSSRNDTMTDRPTGPIASSGLELLTFGTPNGHKASIILEELKEAYGGKPEYAVQTINIGQNIQKEPWFTKYGPNGRIPVLIDHDRDGLGIMEGAAILSYLTRHFDPEKKFTFTEDPDLSVCEQWVAWQAGGLGPMQGQANQFYRFTKDRIPFPTQRYVGESERLYGVLDIRLKDRDYLAGPGRGKYSIADIANFGWVNVGFFAGLEIENFPNLHRWWKTISARPGVQKGLHVPSAPMITKEKHEQQMKDDPEYKEKNDNLKKALDDAKKQFNYKFSAP